MDNFNMHNTSSLYHAFEPSEARRLSEKLEIHFTPKHGSWLNMAEIELSVLSKQRTKGYFDNIEDLTSSIKCWEEARNQNKTGINLQFTTEDARIKLRRLYPEI
jgi:transposase